MTCPLDSANADKAALRAAALARRDALDREQRAASAQAVAQRGLPFEIGNGAVVAGYSPIRSEFDPVPLMTMLAASGANLALPAISGRDRPLIFRAWQSGDPLLRGQLGTLEPPSDAAERMPDIVLVPLAAFDRAGHRIGYGAGHYDRTLEHLRRSKRVIAVGLAFATQQIPAVPALAHDVRLDLVLTETQAIDFRE